MNYLLGDRRSHTISLTSRPEMFTGLHPNSPRTSDDLQGLQEALGCCMNSSELGSQVQSLSSYQYSASHLTQRKKKRHIISPFSLTPCPTFFGGIVLFYCVISLLTVNATYFIFLLSRLMITPMHTHAHSIHIFTMDNTETTA